MKTTPLTRILTCIGGLALTSCTARLVSTPIPAESQSKTTLDGLYYTLPQTVVTVAVPVTLTKATKGKYQEFSDLFFGSEKTTKLEIGTPKFNARGEPDPRQMYLIKGEGDGAIQQAMTFSFSEAGSVTGLKAEVENQTSDLVLAGLNTAVGIVTRAALAGGGVAPTCDTATTPIDKFRECVLKADEQLRTNFDKLDPSRQRTT